MHALGGHIVIENLIPSFSVLTIHIVNVFQKCTLAFEKRSLETKSATKIILIYSRNLSIKIPLPIVKITEEPWSQAQRRKMFCIKYSGKIKEKIKTRKICSQSVMCCPLKQRIIPHFP